MSNEKLTLRDRNLILVSLSINLFVWHFPSVHLQDWRWYFGGLHSTWFSADSNWPHQQDLLSLRYEKPEALETSAGSSYGKMDQPHWRNFAEIFFNKNNWRSVMWNMKNIRGNPTEEVYPDYCVGFIYTVLRETALGTEDIGYYCYHHWLCFSSGTGLTGLNREIEAESLLGGLSDHRIPSEDDLTWPCGMLWTAELLLSLLSYIGRVWHLSARSGIHTSATAPSSASSGPCSILSCWRPPAPRTPSSSTFTILVFSSASSVSSWFTSIWRQYSGM